jgi:PGF-pre-PGF domain-containing protein
MFGSDQRGVAVSVVVIIVAGLLSSMLLVLFTASMPSVSATLTSRYTIFITSNSQFTPTNGVNGGGDGTSGNPYIIENWVISASSANAIEIQNTTAYFIVRNCLLENGGTNTDGIYLYNVINGRIENNTIRNSCDGICLDSSSRNSIVNNVSLENPYHGILLERSSDYNIVTGNTCNNNVGEGGSCGEGIYLDSSSYDNITNNICCGNHNGMEVVNSSNYNIFYNNNCSNNNDEGIELETYSSYNALTNNICSNNTYQGIGLTSTTEGGTVRCSYNLLSQNTCENNSEGIEIDDSSYNTLVGNICKNNYTNGIYLTSSYNTITLNYLLNNNTNGYDTKTNSWDNNGKGSYWSDWQPPAHADANNDGVVDTPRPISGGTNQDKYPLVIGWSPSGNVAPNKPTSLLPSARQTTTNVSISCVVTDNNGNTINVFFYDNSTKNLIDNIWISSGGTATRTWSGLTRGQAYAFFARGYDNDGNWGNNSDVRSFLVNSVPTTPTNWTDLGVHETNHNPIVSWTKGTDADGDTVTTYVYVGTTSTPITIETTTSSTSASLGSVVVLVDGTTYYYRLRSYDGYEYSDYTTAHQFRMNSKPSNPVSWTDLGMNLVNHTPTVTWGGQSDAEGDMIIIYVYVGTTSTPTTEEGHATSGTLNLGSAVPLSDGVTYYYRLRAYDGYEWNDSCTTADQFRINTPPIAKNQKADGLVNPAHLTNFTPTLSWDYIDADSDAQAQRQIQVGTSENASNMWDSTVSTSSTSAVYAGSALSRGTTYYWRVKVYDGYEWSSWLYGGTFKLNQLPTAPILYTDLSMNENDHTPYIEWTKGTDADGDNVWTFIYLDGTNTIYPPTTQENYTMDNYTHIGENSVTLVNGNYYSYRLRSYDSYEWSSYSSIDNFRINPSAGNIPPNIPTNLLPSTRQTATNVIISCIDTDNQGNRINVFFYDNSTKNLIDNVWIDSGAIAQVIWSSLKRGNTYTFFARGQDNNGAWGNNSEIQSFKINQLPVASNQKTEGQTNPTHLTTFAPTFSWTYSDDDSDTQTQCQVQVGTSENDNSMWDNTISTSSQSAVYVGSALSGEVTYYWRVRVYDGYEWSSWLYGGTFSLASPPTTPPAITNVAASGITTSSATITWTTDEPSNSVVEYGTTASYGSTASDATLVTSHYIPLTGLSSGTTYHYRAKSTDASGNTATSSDYTFTTSSPPPPPSSDFSISLDPTGGAIQQGNSTTISVSIEAIGGYSYSVSLSAHDLPNGITVSFSRFSGTPSFTSAMSVSVGENAPPSTYTITITGTGGGKTHTCLYELTITPAVPIPPEIIEIGSPPVEIPSINPNLPQEVTVENTNITGLTIDTLEAAENVRIVVQQLKDMPATIAIGASGTVYQYFNIVVDNLSDTQIENVIIWFKVEKSWITQNGIDIQTITLNRYDPVTEEWASLPTTFLYKDDNYAYFSAVSPGLSVFGISGHPITTQPQRLQPQAGGRIMHIGSRFDGSRRSRYGQLRL